MSEKKKEGGFFKKLFGAKTCCCSVQLEAIEETNDPKQKKRSDDVPAGPGCDAGQPSE